jgi:hypothetical protein
MPRFAGSRLCGHQGSPSTAAPTRVQVGFTAAVQAARSLENATRNKDAPDLKTVPTTFSWAN